MEQNDKIRICHDREIDYNINNTHKTKFHREKRKMYKNYMAIKSLSMKLKLCTRLFFEFSPNFNNLMLSKNTKENMHGPSYLNPSSHRSRS